MFSTNVLLKFPHIFLVLNLIADIIYLADIMYIVYVFCLYYVLYITDTYIHTLCMYILYGYICNYYSLQTIIYIIILYDTIYI